MPLPARPQQRGQGPVGHLERDVVQGHEVAELLRAPSTMMLIRRFLSFERIHCEQRRHRDQRQHQRRRVGARRVELPELPPDPSGAVSVWPRSFPRPRDGAELAERAGGRQDDPVCDPPADRRQGDPAERLPPLAPSVLAACSCSSPISCSTGTTSRTTNGSETKIVARTIPGSAKRIWMPLSRSTSPNHPVRAVEEIQREADDDRRDRERQVDDGVEQRLAAKVGADQKQRASDPEDRVGDHGDRGNQDGQVEGMKSIRGGDRVNAGQARARRRGKRSSQRGSAAAPPGSRGRRCAAPTCRGCP